MNNSRPIFSKALKKDLTKNYRELVNESVERKVGVPNSLKKFLTDTHDTSYVVSKFEQKVFFPVNFKSALEGNYSTVVGFFEEGVELHNKYIAGCRFPDDGLEWFNQVELSDFQDRLFSAFSSLGKALAYKKRRKSAYEAQLFLFKNVTSPLDSFTWKGGCRLDFLFEASFDLLVQSYLSEFINVITFDDEMAIDYQKICKTPSEVEFLDEQIKLYNVQQYLITEKMVDVLSDGLVYTDTKPVINNEDLLFDIYELIPLYIKSWSPDKNKIVLNDELAIFLLMDYGFPSFVIGQAEDKAVNHTTSAFRFSWSVTNDFRCRAKLDLESEALKKIGDFVLNEFHDKLVALLAVRKPETKNIDSVEYANDYAYEVADFTEKYHQALSGTELVEVSHQLNGRSANVPSMMMSSFFTFMQKTFDCNVDNGKGSEMKIWRNGSKIYTLGRHKQDQKIPSLLIKKILKRLDITTEDWLNSLKNS